MKKIMFNDKYGLTQAVLEGRKTMTRRISTALNHPNITDISEWGVDSNGKVMLSFTYDTGVQEDVYPHFQISEVVAVAQSYKNINEYLSLMGLCIINPYGSPMEHPGWNNKMFVAAGLMPHRIRITDIKVERLQAISDEDCMKEGLLAGEQEPGMYGFRLPKGTVLSFPTPRAAFASLIDRISGKGTFDRNPWVFAYEFELIK